VPTAPASDPGPAGRSGPAGPTLELRDLVFFHPKGGTPVTVYSLTFGPEGIGLVDREGGLPRVLPWASVVAQGVEPWAGGRPPAKWLGRPRRSRRTSRQGLPHVEAGALVEIRTKSGSFRFLLARAQPAALSDRITAVAARHRGSGGDPPAAPTARSQSQAWSWRRTRGWPRVRPLLVVLLVVVVAAAVTLILLQSAGVVHLRILGGSGTSGAPAGPRPLLPPSSSPMSG